MEEKCPSCTMSSDNCICVKDIVSDQELDEGTNMGDYLDRIFVSTTLLLKCTTGEACFPRVQETCKYIDENLVEMKYARWTLEV